MKKICVLIPMFGKDELTRKCVDLTIQNAGVKDYDILVVDDGSAVPYADDRVIILRLNENSGFTNAANQGILWAGEMYEYIMMLNNDTEPEPDFIKYLLEKMEENPVIGIASSSRIHNDADGNFLFIENHGLDLVRGHQLVSKTDLPEEIIYVDWIPTCSSLIRIRMIREIGIFDKQFRNHCSDSDYCIRANMNGWNVALVPKSRVVHHWSQTTMENGVNPAEDQKKFIAKLAGMKYAELMVRMPLDCENKRYGRLQFMVFDK